MLKVVSVIFYIISGLFFYVLCGFAFVKLPAYDKFGVMGISFIFALMALGVAIPCSQFQNWKRDVGVVLISSAAFTAFVALSLVFMFLDPESAKHFPPESKALFADFNAGATALIICALIGVLLLKISKNKEEQKS